MSRFEMLLIGRLVCLGGLALSTCRSGGPAAHESQVQAPGVSLYVRVAGNPESGRVLVAISGGPGLSSHYMLDLEQFAGSDFAVVTYDQRGTGRSSSVPPEAAHFDLLRYVEDLEAVREATGADKVHLLGHSWGGLVAMRYATLYPERVDSMVLVGSAPPTWQGLASAFQRINARIQQLEQAGIIPTDVPQDDPRRQEALLRAYFSDPHFWFPADARGSAPEFTYLVNQLTWAAVQGYDLSAEVARIHQRVLIWWGEDDPAGLPMAEETRHALTNAQVEYVVVTRCGHFWHECPDAFYPRVRAFLDVPPGL
jgi:proline iminopeptidase